MLPGPPLVLVHGLWDSPRQFRHLERTLDGRRQPLLVPDLPHGLGGSPIEALADRLGSRIEAAFGPDAPIDLLGFSMGGVIARTWIQLLGGHRRTRRFLSVGSPQQGSLTALPWPRRLLAGIADMKPGSPLLQRLNGDLHALETIECSSYYCAADLMVVPGWRAVLPRGRRILLPVLTHRQLIRHPMALELLVADLLKP
ncbi:triacylglycerol lipase [Synechococcus sp. GFB01]|uniref:esterase/lipase family protein n=1 Tax=Synechococcus sp. GFB01 TaxID=1662190 RepID=UPI00064EE893|nr:alpha/beta fold hydrolase [Synechococcus sp. GFB01]KMM17024.1 alpha/beta hydrolase [Synechococcus sp. GFB01]